MSDRAKQYEQLVCLCEQHDWTKPDTAARFTITDMVKEIGTIEADLIVAAFEGRHLSGEALRKAHTLLHREVQRQNEREIERAEEVAF